MALIGFSTGALAKGDFRRGVDLARQTGTNVIELSALRESELPELVAALPTLDLTNFEYVSVHAPSSFRLLKEQDAIRMLASVADRNIPIVLHPDASLNLDQWDTFGDLLLIENMDKRKPTGRTVTELIKTFESLPNARFCFDIGHARQVDPTMSQAYMILREFAGRVAQIHLSEVASDGRHTRLSIAADFAYPRVLSLISKNIPIVIEAVLNEHELADELSFARHLRSENISPRTRTAF